MERLLIEQAVMLEWQQHVVNMKICEDLSVHELRALLGASHPLASQLRLTLQALGFHPKAPMDERLEARLTDFLATRDSVEDDHAHAAP